jgi:membrane-associated phospholipid phosphatase
MPQSDFLKRRLDPDGRYGLRLTLFTIALLVVGIPFGLLLRAVTQKGVITEIDTSAANHLHEYVLDVPVLVNLLQAVSFLGSPVWFYLVTGLATIYMWRSGHRRLALFLALTGLLGGAIDSIVKIIVDRPRPSLEHPVASAHGMSFPSGHAMTSLVGYGALLLVFIPRIPKAWRKPIWVVAAVVIVAIGFSRLALGVHYISDVLGGYLLGAAWLAASTAAFSIWRVERGKPPVEPEEGIAPEAFSSS